VLNKLNKSIEEFSLQRTDFLLVFLFGSFARGLNTDESDIDVAIMFEKVPDFYELSDLQEQLSGHVGKEVDIVILNTASPVLKMQVLRYGLLIKKDTRTYNDFYVNTLNEYDDLKYFRKEIEDNILRGRIYA
jgi:predicted nucleotidyltransferase